MKFQKYLIITTIIVLALPKLVFAMAPNDPYYSSEWYAERVNAPAAWDKINAAPDVIVAVIDSGVQIDHPDLKDNLWINRQETPGNGIDDDRNGFIDDYQGWDFVGNTTDPNPKLSGDYSNGGISHGTMISGIIGASGNNNLGVSGIAWKVKIMPLKALNDKGEGRVTDVIRAVDYAVNNGANIINLSFVANHYSDGLKEAIERAYRAGVIVVAASGNDSNGGYNLNQTPNYPACYRGTNNEKIVVGVGATDALDQKANFSNYGNNCIDISAPGISFFNLATYLPGIVPDKFNKYYDGFWSGTSMSTALVSGALALVLQANPQLKPQEAVEILKTTADNIDNLNPAYRNQLGGRLNISRAVDTALNKLNNQVNRILISKYSANVLNEERQQELFAAEKDSTVSTWFGFKGYKTRSSVNFASADVNNDGVAEIITGNGYGAEPLIRIYDINGNLKSSFLAYTKSFRGGVRITTGDIDGDGKAEIITAPGSGGGPHIKVFDGKGKVKSQFMAYANNFYSGVYVTSGDLNNDGKAEIITGPGSGSPQVRVFNSRGTLLSKFLAYDKNIKGGVRVAVADTDILRRDNKKIVTTPGEGYKPLVKFFNIKGVESRQFMAFAESFKNGVELTTGDINSDGRSEVIVAAGPGGAPHIRVFAVNGDLLQSFYAFADTFSKGLSIGFISIVN